MKKYQARFFRRKHGASGSMLGNQDFDRPMRNPNVPDAHVAADIDIVTDAILKVKKTMF